MRVLNLIALLLCAGASLACSAPQTAVASPVAARATDPTAAAVRHADLRIEVPGLAPAGGRGERWARRVDGPTPPGVTGRSNGDDPIGQGPGFNSSAITFPTNGCWEVSYRAGDATLRFVVEVAHS